MADDIEYAIISDPDVRGFYTGPDVGEGDFLSEDVAKAAAVARETELREIKYLRGRLAVKRRSGNIAASTHERGNAILDAQQDALECADQPAKNRLPDPLDPYGSPMMDTLPGEKSKPTPRQIAKAAGLTYYVGKPCKRGHEPALRAVVSSGCLACTDLWESENREKVRAHWRESKRRTRAARKLVTVQ